MVWIFGEFLLDRKLLNIENFLEIPIWEIPRRAKFKAIWKEGNGNFPLNIPEIDTACGAGGTTSWACKGPLAAPEHWASLLTSKAVLQSSM